MDYYNSLPLRLSLLIFILCSSLFLLLRRAFSDHAHGNRNENGNYKKLPPGPTPLPILGNILQLTDKPHRALAELSKTHGPLVRLKLGTVKTLVVSSSALTRELFLNHDLAFSSRKVPDSMHALGHDSFSITWLPVSTKWRNLRKIVVVQMFTTKQLDATRRLRHMKVRELAEHARECCVRGEPVDVGRVGFTTTLNLLSNTFFSLDLAPLDDRSSSAVAGAEEFKEIVWRIMECVGKPNLADFFPWMSWLDPQGVRRAAADCFSKMIGVFDGMIRQRLARDGSEEAKNDVLQTLLEIAKEEGSDFGHDDIKHLLVDLFAAGTDTTSSTLEWAMTELLRNPSKMAKAQAELDEVLGNDTSEVQESDIERLPYLQAVVKETLRLHPPAPILVPRKAREDVEFRGYLVAKDTQVLVNIWAIGRDPNEWRDPFEFSPERFMEREDGCHVMMRGMNNFEMIPFGVGRRICPGLPLAYRMVHLMLATLLHGFKWRLEDNEDLDLSEKFGITLQKEKPLLALPVACK